MPPNKIPLKTSIPSSKIHFSSRRLEFDREFISKLTPAATPRLGSSLIVSLFYFSRGLCSNDDRSHAEREREKDASSARESRRRWWVGNHQTIGCSRSEVTALLYGSSVEEDNQRALGMKSGVGIYRWRRFSIFVIMVIVNEAE